MRRSRLVTVLAVVVIAGAGILLPVSLLAAAMLAVGGHGTSTFHPGGFGVLFGPPLALVAGFGLLARRCWAHRCLLALAAALLALQSIALLTMPREERVFVAPDGVPTTVLAGDPGTHLPGIAVAALLLGLLLLPSVRRDVRCGGASD